MIGDFSPLLYLWLKYIFLKALIFFHRASYYIGRSVIARFYGGKVTVFTSLQFPLLFEYPNATRRVFN